MEDNRHWLGYDTVKLIIALILIYLLLVFNPRWTARNAVPPPVAAATAVPTEAAASTTAPTLVAVAAPTLAPTLVPTTAAPALAPTLAPTTAPTVEPTAAPTLAAAPTAAPTLAAAAPAAPAAGDCTAAAPARVEVGKSARVTSNLNLRSAPAIGDNLVRVSPVGAVLKITGGPQCVPYNGGAYRWWQVETADGAAGWSAEATLNGGVYFLQPLP